MSMFDSDEEFEAYVARQQQELVERSGEGAAPPENGNPGDTVTAIDMLDRRTDISATIGVLENGYQPGCRCVCVGVARIAAPPASLC